MVDISELYAQLNKGGAKLSISYLHIWSEVDGCSRILEIYDDGLHSFPNKRLEETELFIDNNWSFWYVFVYKPFQSKT